MNSLPEPAMKGQPGTQGAGSLDAALVHDQAESTLHQVPWPRLAPDPVASWVHTLRLIG